MYRGKCGAKPAKDTKHEDAISNIICQVMSSDDTQRTSVDHQVLNKVTKGWLRRHSKSQLYVRLRMSIQWEDYDHFGFPLIVP